MQKGGAGQPGCATSPFVAGWQEVGACCRPLAGLPFASGPRPTQVLPLGASKAEGLRFLLPRLGVEPREVLALGDGENDKARGAASRSARLLH